MTYWRLVISGMLGVVVGLLVGRGIWILPPGWQVAGAVVLSACLFLWAFHTMRELDERQRVIKRLIEKLEKYNGTTTL